MNSSDKPRSPAVDAFLANAKKWQQEMSALRAIILDSELTEELKWGKPCYTFQQRNVLIIHGFKDYCAVLFCKGALLKDPKGVLVQQTDNVQAARQIRFTQLREVTELNSVLKAYLMEAIEVEKAGLEVTYKSTAEFIVPEELREKFSQAPDLKKAFEALTPGRQRGYLLHFSAAKQSKTRTARIEKCMPQILSGKGLDDR